VVANAKVLGEALAAAGVRLVSGGSDNHLLLLDVTTLPGLTGKIAEQALGRAGVTVNKNMIPYDPRKAMDPSGVRIGTPALTTRGMKETEMKQVSSWITRALRAHDDNRELDRIHGEVTEFCQAYPVPGIG
jgi:glycine hydroxymethyltransferase